MKNNICKAPFFTAEIFGRGDVYLCCPSYTKLNAIGNIFTQSWDEIWNSKEAVEFRNKIKNSDYSDCNMNYCNPGFFPFCREVAYVDPAKLDYDNPKVRIIKFSLDRSCNVACTICRDKVYCNEECRTNFLNSKIDEVFMPLLDGVEIVNFTGTGDPFASKHDREFIKRIAQKYPNIRYDFHTNGILCSKENLERMGVIDKLSTIQISLHSATEETYNKIVKFGNWELLNKNLEFLSHLIEQNKLNELQLNFVVLSENYKDIPAFIQLCKKYHAKAFLWQYRDIEGVYDYDSVNVCYPLHREHASFIRIMTELDTSNPDLFISPLLRKYTQIKNVDEYLLYADIFSNQNNERYESKNGILGPRLFNIEQQIKQLQLSMEDNKVKKDNILKRIFSVENKYSNNAKHKIITILGLKFIFKIRNKGV